MLNQEQNPVRFLRVNGKVVMLDELMRALGITGEPTNIELCQCVQAGVLVSRCGAIDGDPYPGIEVSLELSSEESLQLARCEQPFCADEEPVLRSYLYDRSTDYCVYQNVDTRPYKEAVNMPPDSRLIVSGDKMHNIYVEAENPFVEFKPFERKRPFYGQGMHPFPAH